MLLGVSQDSSQELEVIDIRIRVEGETAVPVVRFSIDDNWDSAKCHFETDCGGIHKSQIGNRNEVIGVDRVIGCYQVDMLRQTGLLPDG